jgi:cytoskeletal protein CcmA (bactofilin family)
MFKNNKTDSPTVGGSATLISQGTELRGDINSDNDLRIDGTIYGNVTSSAKIVVGPSGYVEGNIAGKQADINGKVLGNITVGDSLQLRAECNVTGNLQAVNLQVDPSAVFNGQCQMGTAVNNVLVMSKSEAKAQVQAVEVN